MSDDEMIHQIWSEIRLLRAEVRSLSKFRWQIVGGSIVASLVITIVCQFAFKFIN